MSDRTRPAARTASIADPRAFERRTLTIGELELSIVDEGRGPVLLLIHGNPTSSLEYTGMINALRSDFRCVAVDLPGFGQSSTPAGGPLRPAEHARAVADAIELLDLRDYVLVAHDWGGPIGLAAASQDPVRLGGLALANTWSWPVNDDRHFANFSRLMGGRIGRAAARRFNFIVRVMLPAGHRRRRLGREELQAHLRALATPARREASSAFAREIVASHDFLVEAERRLRIFNEVPALLVWAGRDIAFRPQELARWRAELPHAEIVELPDAGHFVPSDAPQEYAAAIAEWHARRRAPWA